MERRFDSQTIPRAALALGLAGLLPFAAAVLSQYASLPLLAPAFGLQVGIVFELFEFRRHGAFDSLRPVTKALVLWAKRMP